MAVTEEQLRQNARMNFAEMRLDLAQGQLRFALEMMAQNNAKTAIEASERAAKHIAIAIELLTR